jgi:hypothetical protein
MDKRIIKTNFQLDQLYDIDILEDISEDEWDALFNELVYSVGWMMMVFNSLDSLVNMAMDQGLDPDLRRSEINYMIISEMSYSQKVNFIIRHYGTLIFNDTRLDFLKYDLELLEKNLKESGTIRNRYAHANFGTVLNGYYIKVKTKAANTGIYHDYLRIEKSDIQADIKLIEETRTLLENFDEKFWNKIFNP